MSASVQTEVSGACRCVRMYVSVHVSGVETVFCALETPPLPSPGDQGSVGRELRADPPLQLGGHGGGPTAVLGGTERSLSWSHWERELLNRTAREA